SAASREVYSRSCRGCSRSTAFPATPPCRLIEKDGLYKNVRGRRLQRFPECRGRESNPLETDLQSVTLAALSPRHSSCQTEAAYLNLLRSVFLPRALSASDAVPTLRTSANGAR